MPHIKVSGAEHTNHKKEDSEMQPLQLQGYAMWPNL